MRLHLSAARRPSHLATPPLLAAALALTALAGITRPALAWPGLPGLPGLPDVGLSSVRSQHFANEAWGMFVPQAFESFGEALAVGDFNGDGADDLATGTPLDNGIPGSTPPGVGAVTIRYGVPGSLGPGGASLPGGLHGGPPDLVFLESSTFDFPESGDAFGRALASCDFDHNGFDDLAVGAPFEDVGDDDSAGAVGIHYGSAAGLHSLAGAFFVQATPGFPSASVPPAQFGHTLACGDWNGDGFADLAIGSPAASVLPTLFTAGMVLIVNGTAAGLTPAGSALFDEDTPGMPGAAENLDQFGYALATGNFDGDAFDDLAIGSPGETVSGQNQAGAVHILLGSAGGLLATGDAFWGETSLGGLSEDGDLFAYGLAAGDFDTDGHDDLAIGIPWESVGAATSSGKVAVIYGQAAAPAFDLSRTQFLDQDSVLGAGTSEANDDFGGALAAADFDGDGRDDLAIGQPGEFVLSFGDGALTVVMGSAGGLVPSRHRGIAGGFEGVPGNSQIGDRFFSHALAAGDFDGDGHGDLAISSHLEDVGPLEDAGACTVLYGGRFADGFDGGNSAFWSAVAPLAPVAPVAP